MALLDLAMCPFLNTRPITMKKLPPIHWQPIALLATFKLIVHLLVNTNYEIHRDGLLYLALGKHLDFGYWSNPPLIGWISWLAQQLSGGSLGGIRLFPTLAGCGLVVLAGLMARELGGKRYAQFLAALAVALSPAYLRSSLMFQPVIFDILSWTALSYLLLRYLNTQKTVYTFCLRPGIWPGISQQIPGRFFLISAHPGSLAFPASKIAEK